MSTPLSPGEINVNYQFLNRDLPNNIQIMFNFKNPLDAGTTAEVHVSVGHSKAFSYEIDFS
jgi:hypothetical protein